MSKCKSRGMGLRKSASAAPQYCCAWVSSGIRICTLLGVGKALRLTCGIELHCTACELIAGHAHLPMSVSIAPHPCQHMHAWYRPRRPLWHTRALVGVAWEWCWGCDCSTLTLPCYYVGTRRQWSTRGGRPRGCHMCWVKIRVSCDL